MYPNKLFVPSKAELCKLVPKRDIVFCTRLFTEIFYRIEHSSNVCDYGEWNRLENILSDFHILAEGL